MTDEDKLKILKCDLQIFSPSQDEFLKHLLQASEKFIEKEGIKKTDGIEYDEIQIQYAAYLFRKRAAQNTKMPRFLRWELNNLMFSQIGKEKE